MLLDILEGAGNLFDLPGSMVRDAVTLNNPFDQLLSPIGSQNRMSGRDVLEQYGALSPNQEGLDFGDVAGGALGMAMDPLSYISGVGALKFLARGSKVDDVAKLIPKAGQAAARSATGTALVPYRNPLAEVLGMGDAQPLPTSGSVDPSAFLANAFGSSTPLALPAPAAPFYSRLRRAVEALPDKPIKSQSLLNTLKKNPEGISMDEWEWSDMPNFVTDNPMLTKQQILKHMDQWSPSVGRIDQGPSQVIYQGPIYTKDQVWDASKLSRSNHGETWTSPFTGEKLDQPLQRAATSRELANIGRLLDEGNPFEQVMAQHSSPSVQRIFGGKVSNLSKLPRSQFDGYQMPGGKEYLETLLQERVPTSTATYQGPHWEQPNIAAHLRTTTRNLDDVGPVHFVDEFQSDWHQAGRKQGYGRDVIGEYDRAEDARNSIIDAVIKRELDRAGVAYKDESLSSDWSKYIRELDDYKSGKIFNATDFMTPDELSEYRRHADVAEGLEDLLEDAGDPVPHSPLENAWQDVGLKQALYDAAAKNSPGIGWTTGDDIGHLVGGKQSGQNKFYDTEIANRLKKLLGSKGQKDASHSLRGLPDAIGNPDEIKYTGTANYMPIDPKVRARILAEGFPLLAVPLMAALGYGLTPGGNERL